jgi:hypothetical protein
MTDTAVVPRKDVWGFKLETTAELVAVGLPESAALMRPPRFDHGRDGGEDQGAEHHCGREEECGTRIHRS